MESPLAQAMTQSGFVTRCQLGHTETEYGNLPLHQQGNLCLMAQSLASKGERHLLFSYEREPAELQLVTKALFVNAPQ